jgi:hypothetical protein
MILYFELYFIGRFSAILKKHEKWNKNGIFEKLFSFNFLWFFGKLGLKLGNYVALFEQLIFGVFRSKSVGFLLGFSFA